MGRRSPWFSRGSPTPLPRLVPFGQACGLGVRQACAVRVLLSMAVDEPGAVRNDRYRGRTRPAVRAVVRGSGCRAGGRGAGLVEQLRTRPARACGRGHPRKRSRLLPVLRARHRHRAANRAHRVRLDRCTSASLVRAGVSYRRCAGGLAVVVDGHPCRRAGYASLPGGLGSRSRSGFLRRSGRTHRDVALRSCGAGLGVGRSTRARRRVYGVWEIGGSHRLARVNRTLLQPRQGSLRPHRLQGRIDVRTFAGTPPHACAPDGPGSRGDDSCSRGDRRRIAASRGTAE